MFIKRFLFTAVLLVVTISFTGTSKGTSGVSTYVNARETTGVRNNGTYWTDHSAYGTVSAASDYYGSYSADAAVPGDSDGFSNYYSGGVWHSAVAYTYYDGQHGDDVSGSGWASAHITGTAKGSSTQESDWDNISVSF